MEVVLYLFFIILGLIYLFLLGAFLLMALPSLIEVYKEGLKTWKNSPKKKSKKF